MKDKEHGNQIEKTKGNVCQVLTLQAHSHDHHSHRCTGDLGNKDNHGNSSNQSSHKCM